jgi:ATP-binding cassette, subfamily B, bacterial PglK
LSFSQSIFTKLVRLWGHISLRRRRQYFFLISLTLVCALLEIVSLSAVIPFITVISNPEGLSKYPLITDTLGSFGITKNSDLVIIICIGFILVALLAGGMRILLIWMSIHIINSTSRDISDKVLKRILYQPYSVHIANNSSEVISSLVKKIDSSTSTISASVNIIISTLLFTSIITTVFVVNYMVAIGSVVVFGSTYLFIAWLTRYRVANNGQTIVKEQGNMIKTIQEALGGIRDVLLDGTQSIYCKTYHKSNSISLRANGENVFLNSSPRYIMEMLGMVLIASIAMFINYQSNNSVIALPMLGVLALGAQRSLPLMQQLYGGWTTLLGSKAALGDVLVLLDQPLPEQIDLSLQKPLLFQKSIRLNNLSFRYGNDTPWILNDVSLEIPKGARVGIIGKTGSGKSTMADLLMGLLEPVQGEIMVDSNQVGLDLKQVWQRAVAHVPQSIFLTDASIAENIAFGIPLDQIDMDLIHEAAEQARISEFIDSLPESYGANVGERGVKLSGGQRQRIGIARALYKKASVLIFDEATSALDNETEYTVMEAIESLSKDLTLIIIAHRITTLQNCTMIVELGDSGIKQVGSYQDIIN